MSYQSLYRRYRSQKFSEVKGQEHITDALRSAVTEGRHGHAYLFSGPRGTGKTSTARVLAKALNCENLQDGEPCCECESCTSITDGTSFDLHELDAASNNKVDDVRELIAKVHLGSPGRTKVYILDEVHMLSTGAENALLKTLEEPPEHVVFVLATTEPHKVVATIRSRTQHFRFNLLSAEALAQHVQWVANDANLEIDDEITSYVVAQGAGSARDTLSALDLVMAGGMPDAVDAASEIVKAIGLQSAQDAIAAVQNGLVAGKEPRTLGEETLTILRNSFLAAMGASTAHMSSHEQALSAEMSTTLGPAKLTNAMETIGEALVEMRQAADARVPLEVALLRLTHNGGQNVSSLVARIEALEQQLASDQLTASTTQAPAVVPKESPTPTVAAPKKTTSQSKPPTSEPAAKHVKAGPAQAARAKVDQAAAMTKPAAASPSSKPTAVPPPSAPPSPRQGKAAQTPSKPAPEPAAQQEPVDAVASQEPNPTDKPDTQDGSTASNTSSEAATISIQAVTAALGPCLDSLSQKIRVRFRGGTLAAVNSNVAVFSVPNQIHQDRCEAVKAELEEALSTSLGQKVVIELTVAKADATPAQSTNRTNSPDDLASERDEIASVDDLEDATDESSNSIERITKAFPGATVVKK